MIEIYLGLDYKGMWEIKKATGTHIKTVEALLLELANIGKNDLKIRVLESYRLIAEGSMSTARENNDNDNINCAVENLIEILDCNPVSLYLLSLQHLFP